MWLDFCIKRGHVASCLFPWGCVFCDYTEHCNLSDSTMLNIQTVSALSVFICRHTYKGEDSVVLYFCCFEAARYCGDECQRHVYKQVFLSWKGKRGPFCTFSFLQILFPVLCFPFPIKLPIFQFISVTIRQTLSLSSLYSLTFQYFPCIILPLSLLPPGPGLKYMFWSLLSS